MSLSLIEEKWADLALPKEQFDDLVRIGSFGGEIEWNKFFALACSAVAEVSIVLVQCLQVLKICQKDLRVLNTVCKE